MFALTGSPLCRSAGIVYLLAFVLPDWYLFLFALNEGPGGRPFGGAICILVSEFISVFLRCTGTDFYAYFLRLVVHWKFELSQKLKEKNETVKRRNKQTKYEELLVVLMATPIERRKDAVNMLRSRKREVFEIPRGDTLLQNHSSKDHENLAKIPPLLSLEHRPTMLIPTKSKNIAKEDEQVPRKKLECKLQERNQNRQKLKKNQNLINLHDNTKNIETSFKLSASVKLLNYTEKRNCVEIVHRAGKQENLGSTRRAALVYSKP